MMENVKGPRRYDATGRAERAHRSRQKVLSVARRAFLAHGYGATTMAAIAGGAGVSVETVYKAYGNKAGLVEAIHREALDGPGPVPTPEISAQIKDTEHDPRVLLQTWGRFVAEVSPRVSPIMLLVRAAAEDHSDAADLWARVNDQRLADMVRDAQRLADDGHLRPGISVQEAGDILWSYTSPELFDLLVARRGWNAERFGEWVGESFIAALLDSP